jgi:phage FluMu gp28-like protein
VRSADNPDSLRGEGLDYVVLDECAYMQEDAWTNALRPALSDRKGGALFISTPRGRNWFHRLYQRGLGDTDLNWAAWSYPTVDNPYIDPVEIERARQELPSDIFAQEYLAEFVDDGGLVFRNVTACLWEPPSEPERGRRYMAGVDWAQSRDWTVIVVMDDLGRVVAIERSNQIAWDVQRARLAGIVDRWGVVHVLAEANAIGGPNIEQLQVEGLPVVGFMTTNESKSRVIQALVLAFERGGIAIPEHAVLLAELMAFEAGRLPSGRWQYAAPAGMHDDTVIALALAWWAHHNMPEVAFADSPFY